MIYLAEPMFQDGVIAQAVDQVTAQGVSFFSSAGNNGPFGYFDQARWVSEVPPAISVLGSGGYDMCHNFANDGSVDVTQGLPGIVGGEMAEVVLQWDSPAASACPTPGCPGTPNDLDIFLLDARGEVIAISDTPNINADPLEILLAPFLVPGDAIVICRFKVDNEALPNQLGMVDFGFIRSWEHLPDDITARATLYGHANAAGAEAVGAAWYLETPVFGVDPALAEPNTSSGGIPILFDTAGNRLNEAEVRTKPGIVAPDGAAFESLEIDAFDTLEWTIVAVLDLDGEGNIDILPALKDGDSSLEAHNPSLGMQVPVS